MLTVNPHREKFTIYGDLAKVVRYWTLIVRSQVENWYRILSDIGFAVNPPFPNSGTTNEPLMVTTQGTDSKFLSYARKSDITREVFGINDQ